MGAGLSYGGCNVANYFWAKGTSYVMSIGRRYKKGERGARGRVDLELCNGEACEFGLGLPESP